MENGTGGYLKWYTDDKFVFAVYGESLEITKTEIPSEPMYLIMNTAVSYTWGFPMPCPDNCACDCYECGNPMCLCALPTGYCDNFPAGFEIDYVRVYQAANETKHILGCSPASRPTAQFIEGHAKRYMEQGQSRPLQSVRTGGGVCSSHRDCGGPERGGCSTSNVCVCLAGWTGPNCLAHAGFYDVDTSAPVPSFSCKCPFCFAYKLVALDFQFFLFNSSQLGSEHYGHTKRIGHGHMRSCAGILLLVRAHYPKEVGGVGLQKAGPNE